MLVSHSSLGPGLMEARSLCKGEGWRNYWQALGDLFLKGK